MWCEYSAVLCMLQMLIPDQPPLLDDEGSAICSEVQRILLCHREHGMTLTELVEILSIGEDQVVPSPDKLYQYLQEASTEHRTFMVRKY